ncbi:hypothetical protein A9Q83_06305 [Alphaproteobacteria bacterium 46_93_T64]|nr:hypothetical protein A9Q83_06305 [Alphaproteobacteria bacterium 46_93_T64]
MICIDSRNRRQVKAPRLILSFATLRKKSAAVAALLAILLNLLVPITHGLISSAEAFEVLEICTKNGVELVRVFEADAEAKNSGKACPACADCPLCWFGKESQAHTPQNETWEHYTALVKSEDFWSFKQAPKQDNLWKWPSSRAPPAIYSV